MEKSLPSIKQVLAERKKRALARRKVKEQQKEEENRLKVIAYLLNANNITKTGVSYHVSTFAKVWFRDNSNINETLDKYIEVKKIKNPRKDSYLPSIIRWVTSDTVARTKYPTNMFRFSSVRGEIIGKYLLMHPNIKNMEDFNDAMNFQSKNQVKFCHIDMTMKNDLHKDSCEFLQQKLSKCGYEKLPSYCIQAVDSAMQSFYEKNNLIENKQINDLSVDDLEEISNFEHVVKKEMQNFNIDANILEKYYHSCAKKHLKLLQQHPDILVFDNHFRVHPKFNLTTYNITKEQEKIISIDMNKFYGFTNAKDILHTEKRKLSFGVDQNLERQERSLILKRKLFFKYIRKRNKALPPFNHLRWCKNDFVNESLIETTEKLVTLKDYLSTNPNLFARFLEIATILAQEREFMHEVKSILTNKFPNDLNNFWENSARTLLINFIRIMFYDEKNYLISMLDKCSQSSKIEVLHYLTQLSYNDEKCK